MRSTRPSRGSGRFSSWRSSTGASSATPRRESAGESRERSRADSWVEPEQLGALLEAADPYMRPIIATLAGAGLRIGEAVALDWRDVKLSTGTLLVREAKTAAGEGREVDLPVGLREELATWRARSPRTRPGDPLFVSRVRKGKCGRQTPRNVQLRLNTAVRAANVRLAEAGIEPIDKVSPHSLRRSYASLRAALRDDPVYIAEQLGHRDARFTFRVYQRAAKRRERLTGAHPAAFDRALNWAAMGSDQSGVAERIASAEARQELPGTSIGIDPV